MRHYSALDLFLSAWFCSGVAATKNGAVSSLALKNKNNATLKKSVPKGPNPDPSNRRYQGQVIEQTRSFQAPPGNDQYNAPQPPESAVGSQRVWVYKSSRFNPIRQITPESLVDQMDQFKRGYLRQFAMTMKAIAERDDRLAAVVPKRTQNIRRRGYQIVALEESPEAEKHKAVLEEFWKGICVTDSLDLNRKGGFPLLIEQMMDAIAYQWSCHELLWRPSQNSLSCQFNYVPLMWFENRIGMLRFLPYDLAVEGIELEDEAWMITCSKFPLMEPSAVCYMFKKLSLNDWALYNEKHGMPGILGRTESPKGSAQWNNVLQAVSEVSSNFSVVVGKEDEIEKIDFAQEGQLPYPPLVDRMDRSITTLWMGSDLATMSGTDKVGASLQGDETQSVEAGDAVLISETLNMSIDKKVLQWNFGEDVVPKANLRIVIPPDQDIDKDIKTDEFLLASGVRLGATETAKRYGRSIAKPGDEVLKPPQQSPIPIGGGFDGKTEKSNGNGKSPLLQGRDVAANEALEDRLLFKRALDTLAKNESSDLAPLVERIQGLLEHTNPLAFRVATEKLQRELPALLQKINAKPEAAKVLEDALAASFMNGRASEEAGKKRLIPRKKAGNTRPTR